MAIQFDNTNTGSITLAPATTGSWSLALPTALGAADQFLTTNASGVLGYTSSAGSTGFTLALNTSAPNTTKNVSSFSGSAASANVGIAVVPRGTSGVLSSVPDSFSNGGNVRGTYSVDFQRVRSAASMVASTTKAVILGGQDNTNDGSSGGVVAGGYNNFNDTNSGSVILGGRDNKINSAGSQSVIFGGFSNYLNQGYSAIFGGRYGRNYSAQYTHIYAGFGMNAGTPSLTAGTTQLRFMPLSSMPATNVAYVLRNDALAATSGGVPYVTPVPASCVSFIRSFTIARRNTTFGVKSWQTYILVKRTSSGNVTQAGSVNSSSIMATLGTATWTLTTAVNATDQTVELLATSASGTTVPFSSVSYIMDMPI